MTKIIQHNYRPRQIFEAFHRRKQRWSVMVVHRRGGKTVAKINDTISRILYFAAPRDPKTGDIGPPGRFGYVAPFLNQARQVAWDYLKSYSQGMTKKVSEGDLSITYFNDAKYTLYGADNPDAFRGLYFDGVDLDEYGMMKPSVWSEVLLPTLVDRRGWAAFIGTPNGPNHFKTLVRNALLDPLRWFIEIHPVSKTRLIPQEELDEMRKLMLPEEYEQEMECNFDAATRGAFYAAETSAAHREHRITPFEPDTNMPLHFVYDLGFRDDTATICFQEAEDGYPIIHAEDDHLKPIGYYISRIREICDLYGCKRGVVWLPHDAKAKTLQTGRSIVEQFIKAGIRPRIVPELDVLDGIAAARLLFPNVWFNAEQDTLSGPCATLFDALKTYRREWDEDKKAFRNKPVEDWSVHYADVFRYFSLVVQHKTIAPRKQEVSRIIIPQSALSSYTLEDLWKERYGQQTRIR